jgi:hypothetical protein
MALNFPADPENGQVYENYTYDAAKGVWKKIVANLNSLSDVDAASPSDGDILLYTTDGNSWVTEPLSSDIVPEGTVNLYYTDSRVDSVIDGKTTDDIEEGTTNLYYTDERVETVISNSDTDDLSEGTTNLYYTNERVDSFISEEVSATLPATFDGETLTIGVDQDEFTHISTLEYADFDLDPADNAAVGRLWWNKDLETLNIGLDEDVTLQVGQEHLVRVKNDSNTTPIPEGKLVMFAGAQGDTVSVAPAVSDGSVNHNYVLGITTEEIAEEGFGFVTQYGFVNGIKTDYDGWQLGSLLYADPANPGELTHIEPISPAWKKPIAAVTFVSASAGRILVRIATGEVLGELHDVNVSSAEDGDALVFNTTTNTWVAGSVTIDSTDEVSEGTTNLYFTNQRAIDAVKDNIELNDLSDVDTTGVADGDALIFDTATSSWIPGEAGTTINSINDIADVDTSAKQDGYVLTYNGTSSEWEAAAPTGGSGGTADDNAIFKATLFFGGN